MSSRQVLLSFGANPEAPADAHGSSCVFVAARRGDLAVTRLLLQSQHAGAESRARRAHGVDDVDDDTQARRGGGPS